ncbi:g7286 [Coccomyxa viridis]|uniref:G7286 protein n=1 Tax=Coccomyxa viridis TaxID=1274662 RepID=A0ABP1G1I1_9CHLO
MVTTHLSRTSSSMRKPLYPIEKGAQSATVCVTGGTGYIAGAIIARLLAAGHTVHATVRDPSNEQKLRWLRALPNASSHLKFFKADLEDAEAFRLPIRGCKYVLHTASPVVMAPPKGKEMDMVIRPAVSGVENVLRAVNESPSVQRVVLTSSVAAIVGDHWERGRDHVYTEADWNQTATQSFLPYHRSKVLAEQKAFEMCKQQSRWSLVTIQPSVVQGPPPGNVKCEVVGFMRKIMNGGYYPWAPRSGAGYVDIDDVAAAHTLAMLTHKASGRYIVSAESLYLPEFIDRLRPEYSMYKLPFVPLPYWVIWFAVTCLGMQVFDLDLIRCTVGKLPHFDNSKAREELGLDFTDVRQSAQDMAASLLELRVVKAQPGAPVSKFYSKL